MRTMVFVLAVALGLATAAAHADPIEVGSGTQHASLVVNFSDGAGYVFDVAFDGTMTGLGLFDAVEAEEPLTTIRMDFGFGIYIDGISYDGHTDSGFGGDENYWHYWVKDGDAEPWVSPQLYGVADRTVAAGYSDGWVYGTAGEPVVAPEPATLALLALGAGSALARRRRRA